MEVRHLDSQLLTRCLRRGPNDDLHSELRGIDGESWRRLVDGAVWHGVAPLLYHRLKGWENPAIPPEQLERLRDLYLHSLLRNQAILEQLSEILRETTRAGYSVMVLKGAYLSTCVYEEPALRPMGDIDLLAMPDTVEHVQRRLETLGYRYAAGTEAIDYSTLHHLRPVSRPGSVDVEVHHDLAPAWAPFEHDRVGLWDRSTHTRVGDLDLLHPAPDDVLLHVCTHAAFNDEFRLGLAAVCDVDAVVWKLGRDFDWARFIQTANSDGRSRFAYAVLRLSRTLLKTPIADDVLASLHHDAADDEVAAAAAAYVLSTSEFVPDTLRHMGDSTTLRARLGMLWRGIFPPAETMRRIYRLGPDTRLLYLYLYYAARPVDLLFRRGRRVFGLVIGSPDSRSAMDKERHRRMIRAWVKGKTPGA